MHYQRLIFVVLGVGCLVACGPSALDRKLQAMQEQFRTRSKPESSQGPAPSAVVSATPKATSAAAVSSQTLPPTTPRAQPLETWPAGKKHVLGSDAAAKALFDALGFVSATTEIDVELVEAQMDSDQQKERLFTMVARNDGSATYHGFLVKAGKVLRRFGPLQTENLTVSVTDASLKLQDLRGDGIFDLVVAQSSVQVAFALQGAAGTKTSVTFDVWSIRRGEIEQVLQGTVSTQDEDAARFAEMIHLERSGTSKVVARFGEEGMGAVLGEFVLKDGSNKYEQIVKPPSSTKTPSKKGSH